MEKYIIESVLLGMHRQKYFKVLVWFSPPDVKMWQQKDIKNKPFVENCSFTFKYLMSSPGTSFEPDWISWQWWKNLCTWRSWKTDGHSHMKSDSLPSNTGSHLLSPPTSCKVHYLGILMPRLDSCSYQRVCVHVLRASWPSHKTARPDEFSMYLGTPGRPQFMPN